MGSLIPGAAAADNVDIPTEITFKSENEIVDTPEALAILEEAMVRAADASHDADAWHLVSEKIVSSSHSHGNERKLRPYLQYNQRDRSGWKQFWADYFNRYIGQSNSVCGSCRRRLGERKLSTGQDDPESHANWEATLCELLNETEIFAGVSDCVISFVDPSDVEENKVENHIDITFKTGAQVHDTEELLEAIETALLMASDQSHDPKVWFLDSSEITSFSHVTAVASKEGERKLRPYLQFNQIDRGYNHKNYYRTQSTSNCGSCRRNLGEGSHADDAESHANWEAILCKLLDQIDGLEGVTDCVVAFVEE